MKCVHKTVKVALKNCKNDRLFKELWTTEHGNTPIKTMNREFISWENSLPILLRILNNAGLKNLDIFLEYPSITTYGRIDAMLVGRNYQGKQCLILFELKQWDKIIPGKTLGKSEVFIPQVENKARTHPLFQLMQYKQDFSCNSVTASKNIKIYKIALLHNLKDITPLISGQYEYWSKYKDEIYCKNDFIKLENFLRNTIQPNEDREFANQLSKAEYKLTNASFKDLSKAMNGQKFATMVSDQIDVERKVVNCMRKAKNDHFQSKKMILIQGAPGTGKTIIGLQLLCDYKKMSINNTCTFCLPRSRTVHSVINKETGIRVPYTNRVPNSDIIIVDEAHRMSNISQELNDLYKKTNFLVLLQDDLQRIQINEHGTYQDFLNYAQNNNIEFLSQKLSIQKRSGFLDNFIENIDGLLYGTPSTPFSNADFKFGIYSSPQIMLNNLKKNAKDNPQNRNKLIASFDWPWRYQEDDITIGNFKKPWNPGPFSDQANWYLATGKDSVKTESIDKIGCIYTTQGLEFDNVGFIWGKDFTWNKASKDWQVNINELSDDYSIKKQMKNNNSKEENLQIMKNIYHVLLTRATKGLGIFFLDNDTREYVQSFFNKR